MKRTPEYRTLVTRTHHRPVVREGEVKDGEIAYVIEPLTSEDIQDALERARREAEACAHVLSPMMPGYFR